jgi:hypothetical protein
LTIFFYPLLPRFLEQFQQVSLFHLHTRVYVNIGECTIFTLLYPFPTSSPIPLVWIPQAGSVPRSCSLILQKKKKWHFCLFKIAIQGVSLWHFHMYICIIVWFGSSPLFFLFLL